MPITKALITAAGRGTRFLPVVKGYAKELVPILNKPQIQYLVEEAIGAGITDVCIVHRPKENSIKNYFSPCPDWEKYLTKVNKLGCLDSLKKIHQSLHSLVFIPQSSTLPYGNASPILAASSFIGSDPFVFMFGDDLTVEIKPGQHLSTMINSFITNSAAAVVAVQKVPRSQIHLYGCAVYKQNSLFPNQLQGMIEKPDNDTAPSLHANDGRFVFSAKILLPLLKQKTIGKNNELWLADNINLMAKSHLVLTQTYKSSSSWETTGDPLNWLKANIAMARLDPKFDI